MCSEGSEKMSLPEGQYEKLRSNLEHGMSARYLPVAGAPSLKEEHKCLCLCVCAHECVVVETGGWDVWEEGRGGEILILMKA